MIIATLILIWRHGISYQLGLMLCLTGLLYLASISDMKIRRIPNRIILTAVLVRMFYFAAEVFWWKKAVFLPALLKLLGNALSVSLPLLLLTVFMEKHWKKAAFGGGDIKLLFVTGLYLGAEVNLWILFLTCIVALVMLAVRRLQVKKKEWKNVGQYRYVPLAPAVLIAVEIWMLLGYSEHIL